MKKSVLFIHEMKRITAHFMNQKSANLSKN